MIESINNWYGLFGVFIKWEWAEKRPHALQVLIANERR